MEIPQLEFMATVVAAYEFQGHTVKKYVGQQPGNRELIIGHLSGTSLITITDLHREQAQILISGLENRCIMKKLMSEKISDFMHQVITAFQKTHININKAGILAWAPKMLHDLLAADDHKMEFAVACNNSEWFMPKPRGGIKITFVPIVVKYSKLCDQFFHDGHDGAGNRVQFRCRSKFDKQVVIKARVKSHVVIDLIKTTIFNYVKQV